MVRPVQPFHLNKPDGTVSYYCRGCSAYRSAIDFYASNIALKRAWCKTCWRAQSQKDVVAKCLGRVSRRIPMRDRRGGPWRIQVPSAAVCI